MYYPREGKRGILLVIFKGKSYKMTIFYKIWGPGGINSQIFMKLSDILIKYLHFIDYFSLFLSFYPF